MDQETLKKLISNHLADCNDPVDLTESILNQLRTPKKRRRPALLIAVLILTFATSVFAATIHIIELRNENGSTDMAITILEVNHEEHDKVFEKFDRDMIPFDLRETVSMTVYVPDYTYQMVNHFCKNITSYSNIYTYNMTDYLPEVLSNYLFKSATIGYHYKMPSQEEIEDIASKHSEDIFYTFPLEITDKTIIYYEYLNTTDHLFYDIALTKGHDQNYFDIDSLEDYEIIQLEHTEAFLFKRMNSDYTYIEGEKVDKIIGNNYEIIWFDQGYKYSVRPSGVNKLLPDIKKRHIYNFPDVTREDLISLAQLLHQELSGDKE